MKVRDCAAIRSMAVALFREGEALLSRIRNGIRHVIEFIPALVLALSNVSNRCQWDARSTVLATCTPPFDPSR